MVYRDKSNYGSAVYIASPLPQFPKSARRRRSIRKKQDDKQLSAIDLLATVALELLSEKKKPGSDLNDNIKKAFKHYYVPTKSEDFNQDGCNKLSLHAEPVHKRQVGSYTLNKQFIGRKTLNKMVTEVDVKKEDMSEILGTVNVNVKPGSPISYGSNMEKLGVSQDDDENSSGCTRSYSIDDAVVKTHRPKRVGEHRGKVNASGFSKGSHILKRNLEILKTVVGKKIRYTQQRTKRSSFRRWEIYQHHWIDSSFIGNGESDQRIEVKSGEYPVEFSIKSFTVPEILIDVPQTATVGFLKRQIVDAVTAMVADGLKVGIVYKGKEVCDDSQTLLQTGIFHNNKIADLGFVLESRISKKTPAHACSEAPTVILSSELSLPCPAESVEEAAAMISKNDPLVSTSVELMEHSNNDSVQSSLFEMADNSKAIIPVSLGATPSQIPKKQGFCQRRIRRPFSVNEVEALVHAVEMLGTGRWREIKIMAFDNAEHRTYVDLKDKWKTLVHTASIAPQQRRGAPVPQELLDRVLMAHNYWSQQRGNLKPAPSTVNPLHCGTNKDLST